MENNYLLQFVLYEDIVEALLIDFNKYQIYNLRYKEVPNFNRYSI